MYRKFENATSFIFAFIAFVLFNIIVNEFEIFFDFTREKIHTISDLTVDLIRNSSRFNVSISSFFTYGIDPNLDNFFDKCHSVIKNLKKFNKNIDFKHIDISRDSDYFSYLDSVGVEVKKFNSHNGTEIVFCSSVIIEIADKTKVVDIRSSLEKKNVFNLRFLFEMQVANIIAEMTDYSLGDMYFWSFVSSNENIGDFKERFSFYNFIDVTSENYSKYEGDFKDLIVLSIDQDVSQECLDFVKKTLDNGKNVLFLANRFSKNSDSLLNDKAVEFFQQEYDLKIGDQVICSKNCLSVSLPSMIFGKIPNPFFLKTTDFVDFESSDVLVVPGATNIVGNNYFSSLVNSSNSYLTKFDGEFENVDNILKQIDYLKKNVALDSYCVGGRLSVGNANLFIFSSADIVFKDFFKINDKTFLTFFDSVVNKNDKLLKLRNREEKIPLAFFGIFSDYKLLFRMLIIFLIPFVLIISMFVIYIKRGVL